MASMIYRHFIPFFLDRRIVSATLAICVGLIVSLPPAAAARADTVPRYDVQSACRGAAAAAVAPGRTSQSCENDETSARDTLDKQWSDYPDADRARCVRASSLGGPASYVDLLTCLDMAKSVRALPKDRQDPLGVPPASR
ncbi:MAG: hypothetical protein J0H78_11290 [Rhizobiales bacterium]|nr:hypothetical protein [Hyphomicrobiales bacterium]